MTNRTLSDLPTLELEDPLNRVLVKPKKIGNGSIAKRRFLFDESFNRLGEGWINLRRYPAWLIVDATPSNPKPTA